MAEPLLPKYIEVLCLVHERTRRNKDKSISFQMLCDAFRVSSFGIVNTDKVYDHIQFMVRWGYLVPIQAGVGVMDKYYQVGEDGLELIAQGSRCKTEGVNGNSQHFATVPTSGLSPGDDPHPNPRSRHPNLKEAP